MARPRPEGVADHAAAHVVAPDSEVGGRSCGRCRTPKEQDDARRASDQSFVPLVVYLGVGMGSSNPPFSPPPVLPAATRDEAPLSAAPTAEAPTTPPLVTLADDGAAGNTVASASTPLPEVAVTAAPSGHEAMEAATSVPAVAAEERPGGIVAGEVSVFKERMQRAMRIAPVAQEASKVVEVLQKKNARRVTVSAACEASLSLL